MTRSSRQPTPAPNAPAVGDTAALTVPQLRSEVIRQSHRRSAALGLSRGERLAFAPMMRSDLGLARERNQRLCAHAAPVMQVLFEQIAGTDSMIVLTDAHGTILHSVGDDDFLARATRVALAPGENWAEHAKGTNAIGTALFEEQPTLVHASEHFIHANSFLTCSAAPIFDPRGQVLGVLDVTGDHRGYHQHTMGLVRMSARMIENHWLGDDHNQHLRLHFHSRRAFIGTLLEGIVAVAPDGRILGGNRSALDQLGLSAGALRAQNLASLFGTSTATLHDHFRSPLATPLRLHGPSGQPFHVSAQLESPAQPVLAGAARAELARPHAVVLHQPDSATPPNAGLQALCTGDPQVERLVQMVRRAIAHDIPLLLLGEPGTGKQALARAVHQDSIRAGLPFVAVDCAALPAAALAADLFGTDDGGGASPARPGSAGRIAQARGGTLFLNAIDTLPLALQARLLRVLQEPAPAPQGSVPTAAAGAAATVVIAATQRHLRDMISQQAFREDLYYRLCGLALRLPPLRERSDLEALARNILLTHSPVDPPAISPPVLDLFRRYRWPGNVRQLAHVLRTAAVMSAGERSITTAHLSDDFLEEVRAVAPATGALQADPTPAVALTRTLQESETELIRHTLQALGGNVTAAARQLGISRNTLYRRLNWKVER